MHNPPRPFNSQFLQELTMLPEILVRSDLQSPPRAIQLERGCTAIGRGPSSGLFLSDPSISRDHGAFSYYIGLLMVEDHDSTNGIFVNGRRVKRQVLYAGDQVSVGPFQIVVKSGSVPTLETQE
jgi:pSer/pThr/pTyr-binding forkhead associated (FHA) protein